LLLVPVDRPQQRVDVEVRQVLDAGQQWCAGGEADQVSAQHRPELRAVSVGELAQEDPQRRRRIHLVEHDRAATRPDGVHIVDVVGSGERPTDDRGQFPDRVRAAPEATRVESRST